MLNLKQRVLNLREQCIFDDEFGKKLELRIPGEIKKSVEDYELFMKGVDFK